MKSRALQAQMPEVLFELIRTYKPVLSTQCVRSIIHPICGCATNVIQKNYLRVIMWLVKLHCNEMKVTFMSKKNRVARAPTLKGQGTTLFFIYM